MELEPVTEFPAPGRLFRIAGPDCRGSPVLLTHGTFSDAGIVSPLAMYLAGTGREVFVIEWRGRDGKPGDFDFHDLADGEISHALGHISRPAHLVAHSGGGLAMCFAQLVPATRALAQSLTLIATQGTHLGSAARLPFLGIRALEIAGRFSGTWSAGVTRLGPCNESARLLSQWVQFNLARQITTRQGDNLLPMLRALDLPVFSLAGAGDLVIARPQGCEQLARAFGAQAQFHLCTAKSDGEDFTHARLIRSRRARQTVWPRISHFMDSLDPP